MPRMDGITFCRKVHEVSADTRIVMISAYQDIEYIRAAFKYEAVDYILKPFKNKELLQVVDKAARKVEQIRRNRTRMLQMESRIDESMPVLRQRFLYDLAKGRIRGHEAVTEKLGSLDIPLSADWPAYAMLAWLDPVGVQPVVTEQSDRDKATGRLADILEKRRRHGLSFALQEDQWMLILRSGAGCGADAAVLAGGHPAVFQ